MRRRRPDLLFLFVILAILLAAWGLTILNQRVIVPLGGDQVFAPIWEGAQIATRGEANPYETSNLSRSAVLLSDDDNTPRFLYPYYSLVLFGPFSAISPYSLARAVWTSFIMVSMVGLAFTALVLTRWRPKPLMLVAFLLFALGQFQSVRAVFLGSPAIVVGLLVSLGLLMVVQEQYGLAGIFFGLSIIKPEMVILLLPFVLVWGVSKRAFDLVMSMLVTIALLVGGAFAVFPQWLGFNYFEFLSYFEESFPASANAVIWRWLPGNDTRVMTGIAILLGLWMVVEWWRALGKDSRWFLWTAAMTIVFTNLIGVPTSLSNFVLLIVPLTLVFSIWAQRWRQVGERFALLVMVLLLGLEWGLGWLTMRWELTTQASGSMLIFLPVMTLIMLYWVRYWALNSIKLKTEHIEALRRL
ncbi:DUF2029 domain-containing protein [bacterium]|nr:DUF2029 domain-containing protein [bacterium]MCB2179025.1 DUF2029 domain-containing protein [bacterium]